MTATRVSKSFRVEADLPSNSARKLPKGHLSYTFAIDKPTVRVRVQAAYLKIGDRGRVAEHKPFDDGQVVLDFDDKGRVAGVELLCHATPDELPELLATVRASDDPVLPVAVATILTGWGVVETGLPLYLNVLLHSVAVADRQKQAASGLKQTIEKQGWLPLPA